MLKTLVSRVLFNEIPGEISLGISISNCQIKCPNCHSKFLWEDKGEPLDRSFLDNLIKEFENTPISTILFLGGEHEARTINYLAKHIKKMFGKKVAWYCGLKDISESIDCQWFDYIKLGPYIERLGGLNSITTNQVLYKVSLLCSAKAKVYKLTNINSKFNQKWKTTTTM